MVNLPCRIVRAAEGQAHRVKEAGADLEQVRNRSE